MSAFIAVEWGTAAIAARLIAADGTLLDTVRESIRLTDLDPRQRIERLRAFRTRWPAGSGPILLAGMIGSPMGIATVEQSPCPADPAAIGRAARQMSVDGLDLVILPGLSSASPDGARDVLRGEEVAAAGLIAGGGNGARRLVSVPGMHGKWLTIVDGWIEHFHTAMTVELYRALADRSILGPLMQAPGEDGPAFRAGVERGAAGGALTRLLFCARAAVLAGTLAEGEAASHLWGILIGADVADALSGARDLPHHVAGAAEVAPLFHAALAHLGAATVLEDGDALAARGFAHLRATMTRELAA